MKETVFLTYRFNGWVFEFGPEHIEATNPANGYKYKIQLEPYEPIPFLITLIEKGAIR